MELHGSGQDLNFVASNLYLNLQRLFVLTNRFQNTPALQLSVPTLFSVNTTLSCEISIEPLLSPAASLRRMTGPFCTFLGPRGLVQAEHDQSTNLIHTYLHSVTDP
mmetsp:Transcript_21048/g.35896  ORF Transcript_21048/g.35896 Transcript_21048/m.35896 type:complete len:106 (-) Transcript_21048:262-579(-)